MSPILSVAICTYNRSDWLQKCLSSLELQCKDDTVEVLIIDNNSSDATFQVAQQFTGRLPNFKYIFEGMQGLSHARNRAIHDARGQYVAYLDDDAKAFSDWVNATIHFFEITPDASGVGGPYNAFSMILIPYWFPKEFGCWSLGDETRKMRKGEWINGTNMAFKKQALIDVGGFDSGIGMTGNKISYGEETNLMLRMLALKMQLYYCAEMRVDHAVLPHKLKLRWLLHSCYANGYDGVKTLGYKGGAIGYLPVLVKQAGSVLIRFLFCNERYIKTRIYRSLKPMFWHAGFFVKLMDF
jgi:glycosyltransferase involved in cell wall biosynthesis